MLICAIGAGGKTTAVCSLALAEKHRPVLLTTTTHMRRTMPPGCRTMLIDPDKAALCKALSQPGIVFAGTASNEKKISSLTDDVLRCGIETAQLTLIEADGAHCLPLKLHADFEPVIPDATDRCLILCGTSSMGIPVSKGVHRYQLNADWAAHPDTIVDASVILECAYDAIRSSRLPKEKLTILISQMQTEDQFRRAHTVQTELAERGYDVRLWPHNTAIPFSAES